MARDQQAVVRAAEATIGYPAFVKPANGGSSLGTSKARSREDLDAAIAEAFRFDRKVLDRGGRRDAREVEVAVLGNDEPEASPVGEITFDAEFYDYRAKYDDPRTVLHIPADIPAELAERLRETAIEAYKAIDCAGLARVDFFVLPDGRYYLNEVNTIPGFTPTSMYPKLWEYAGLSYRDLITPPDRAGPRAATRRSGTCLSAGPVSRQQPGSGRPRPLRGEDPPGRRDRTPRQPPPAAPDRCGAAFVIGLAVSSWGSTSRHSCASRR